MQLALLTDLDFPTPHAVDLEGGVWRRHPLGVWLRGVEAVSPLGGRYAFLPPKLSHGWPTLTLEHYIKLLADRPLGARPCRVCGCTDEAACPGGCSWVEWDLCSTCAEALAQVDIAVEDGASSSWTSEDLRRHRAGRFACTACGQRKNSSAPFCRRCAVAWRAGTLELTLGPCPTCGAPENEPCVTTGGVEPSEIHRHRPRSAASKDSIGLRKQTSSSTLTTTVRSSTPARSLSQAAPVHAHDTSANRGFSGAERRVTSPSRSADRAPSPLCGPEVNTGHRTTPLIARLLGAAIRRPGRPW